MSSIQPFSEVLHHLKQEGYTVSFGLTSDGLLYSAGTSIIGAEDFTVDAHYSTANMFSPTDEVVVYAISSDINHVKGVYISSDESDMNSLTPQMLAKFSVEDNSQLSDSPPQTTVRATRQRPEGSRALNQEMLTFDTDALISQIKSEEAWTKSDRNSLTIFKNDTLCMVIVGLHPEAAMKKHSATGAITVQVLQGDIIFETLNQKSELTRGKMIALPAGIPHQVYAVKESFFLLTLALQK